MPNLLEITLYHMYPLTSNTESPVKTLDEKEIELNISSLVAL